MENKSRSHPSNTDTENSNNEMIVKQGYLKKQKTMKKKYFVLHGESPEAPARLEYYDSEKKFKANQPPKRSIILKNCFNINKQTRGKVKHVIALFTRNDPFYIAFDNEEEMEVWLKLLLELQWGEDIPGGTPIRPNFEHVWPVRVLEKALGAKTGIFGYRLLCLTEHVISLAATREDGSNDVLNFSLQKIRRCGNFDTFFYMEVGQQTVTGAGHLWMEAEDANIALNVHNTILVYWVFLNQSFKLNKLTFNNVSPPPSWDFPKQSKSSTLQEFGLDDDDTSSHRSAPPASTEPPTRRASTGTRPSKIISSSPQTCSSEVRDRADSMPTRTRKPLEAILSHLSRPHKVFTSGLIGSNNFWSGNKYRQMTVNESVVRAEEVLNSPPSVACSTDSAGSSYSIEGDTVDGHWDDSNNYGHDGGEVILEENDYALWQAEDVQLNNYVQSDLTSNYARSNVGSVVVRKTSPNPMINNFKSASPGKGSYKEMYSPCSTSPADTSDYMPMSPEELRTLTTSKPASINHSRGSSIVEEGYVPMAPGSNKDEYVDMDHGSNHHKSGRYQSGDLSRTESSSSVTSGTPSSDHRFSDYPLDKVNSYFPADEEINPAERPTRAYSVGSRPNSFNRRTEGPPVTTCERTRAFSVGSRSCKPGVNQLRVALNNSHALTSSHSSVEPSEDMMEMDFSKKGRSMRHRKKITSSERLSVPCGSVSSTTSSYSTAEGSYMDMSPRASSPSLMSSPPKASRFLAALSKSPPKHAGHDHLQDMQPLFKSSPPVTIGYPSPSLGRVPEGESGYMEMSSSDSGELKASHQYIVHQPLSDSRDKNSYMEMKPSHPGEAKHVIAKNVKARVDSFPETVHVAGSRQFSSNKLTKDDAFRRKLPLIEDNNNCEYIPLAPGNFADEYVEMNMSRRSTTILGKFPEETDYMNMSITPSRRDSTRSTSKPIKIQSSTKEVPENTGYLIGRKSSVTPPKVPGYLPLTSSLSPSSSSLENRARARKHQERRNSKESNSSITTPIFPFSMNSPANSPGSYDNASKCPVDVSSGTVRLSYHADSASEEDLSKTAIFEDVPVDDDYLNYEPDILSGTISSDMMNPNATNSPASVTSPSALTGSFVSSRKSSAPAFGSKLKPFEKLLSGLGSSFSSLTIGSSQTASSSQSDSIVALERNDASSSGGDETPTPTPEDDERKTTTGPMRKASDAHSEKKLHYASLDLARSASEQSDDSGKVSFRPQSSLTESSSGSSSSPNTTVEASEFRYAEIDFAKSTSRQGSTSSSSAGNVINNAGGSCQQHKAPH